MGLPKSRIVSNMKKFIPNLDRILDMVDQV